MHVRDNAEEIQTTFLSESGIDTVFEVNPGGHHDHTVGRTTAGICCLSEQVREYCLLREAYLCLCGSKFEAHEILSFPPLTHALTHTGKYACGGARKTSADLMIQPPEKG